MTGKMQATTGRKGQTEPPQPRVRELAYRRGPDIEVTLFWRPDDDSVLLLLVEVSTGVAFEVPLDSSDALDAFNHPYAYLPTQAPDPWPLELAA